MSGKDLEQILEELKNFEGSTRFLRIKSLLQNEIKKVENEIAAKKESEKKSENAEPPQSFPTRRVVELNEHAFDESDKFVKIFIPFSHATLSDENVAVNFTESSFTVTITTAEKDYKFSAKSLLKPVNVEKSYKKVKPQDQMVALYLKKQKEGVKWAYLTTTEKLIDTRSKQIDDDNDVKDDPMGGLMKIMQKMYESGDPEMKRTIAKAWTEGQEKSKGSPMM